MIKIEAKKDCCGCEACVQRCPKHCISMNEDEEGFLYPMVNENLCIDCGLCEKVCPVINQSEPRLPLNTYAAINPDEEIRLKSSSGGIFTLFAKKVLEEHGVVFGARFDENWNVIHSYTETIEGLAAFRGSKYVQSQIGENYHQAESFLKSGRIVLFSGTPCQIAGLKRFLRKDYENLFSIDFICHGVPSPGVWRRYLKEECARQCAAGKNTVLPLPIKLNDVCITNIEFRNKRLGWKKFSFALTLSVSPDTEKNSVLLSEPLNTNLFLRGFLRDLYLRPSCYACPTKELKSGSDITIADFWGIQEVKPEIDDDKGIGVMMVNTDKGKTMSESLKITTYDSDFATIVKYNPSVVHPVTEPNNRSLFFQMLTTHSFLSTIAKTTAPTLRQRIRATLPVRALRCVCRKIGNKK